MVKITAVSCLRPLLVLVDLSVCWPTSLRMIREVADLTEKRLFLYFPPRFHFKRFGDSSLWDCSSHQGCNLSLSGAAWFRLVGSCLPLDWTAGSFQAGVWRKLTQRQICEYQHSKFSLASDNVRVELPSFPFEPLHYGNCAHSLPFVSQIYNWTRKLWT